MQLIQSNINRNKHLLNYSIEVQELDFTSTNLPSYIIEKLPKTPLVIAADGIKKLV